jgi:drug/metabolite transporter (DMT)-like permease
VSGRQLVGIALVVVSAFGYGSGPLFAKPVYAAGVDWHTLMAWRFLLGAGLAWGWVLLIPARRAGLRAMDRRALAVAIALGIMFTTNSGTYFAALETVSASLGALIVYIYPALVAVLSLRVGRRLEGRRAWASLGLALAGVALAVGNIDTSRMPPVSGLLLMIASPIIYSVWIVLAARFSGERRTGVGRDAAGSRDPIAAGAVMMSATAITFWITALAVGRPVLPWQIPQAAWGGIAGVGVGATFIAILGFYSGAHRIGAARASLISTVEPVWTIVWAAVIFGERLTPLQLVGGAMILTGVILAQSRPAPETVMELRLADE